MLGIPSNHCPDASSKIKVLRAHETFIKGTVLEMDPSASHMRYNLDIKKS